MNLRFFQKGADVFPFLARISFSFLEFHPQGWTLPLRDVLVYSGAKFLCPCAGAISLMPGTSSDPAFRRVDVDVQTGKVKGLF
jgi:formyltetrahydrofolate synthetase